MFFFFKNNERSQRQFALNYYVSCVYVYIVICGDIEIFIFPFQLEIMLLLLLEKEKIVFSVQEFDYHF